MTFRFFCSVSDISCSDIFTSEVVAKRELNLAVRSQADSAFHCLSQQTKRAARSRLRERTVGLKSRRENARSGDRRHRVVQRRGRKREIRLVEDVEDLRAEFDVRRLRDPEALVEDE